MSGTWGYNAVSDEEADEAESAYAQDGYEPGFNMDDGRDVEDEIKNGRDV